MSAPYTALPGQPGGCGHLVWCEYTFAKQLIGAGFASSSPFLLAGLLYLGSGLGLALVRFIRDEVGNRRFASSGMAMALWCDCFRGYWVRLLMVGLSHTTAATASLLLNLESVLTAVLAWMVFRESTDRRIVLGMVLIVMGGAVLAWPTGDTSADWIGPLALAGACLALGH